MESSRDGFRSGLSRLLQLVCAFAPGEGDRGGAGGVGRRRRFRVLERGHVSNAGEADGRGAGILAFGAREIDDDEVAVRIGDGLEGADVVADDGGDFERSFGWEAGAFDEDHAGVADAENDLQAAAVVFVGDGERNRGGGGAAAAIVIGEGDADGFAEAHNRLNHDRIVGLHDGGATGRAGSGGWRWGIAGGRGGRRGAYRGAVRGERESADDAVRFRIERPPHEGKRVAGGESGRGDVVADLGGAVGGLGAADLHERHGKAGCGGGRAPVGLKRSETHGYVEHLLLTSLLLLGRREGARVGRQAL